MSSWLKNIFGGGKAPGSETWQARLAREQAYEHEGARDALGGKDQFDNPYDKEVNSDGWNFWLYGYENARHEQEVIRTGELTYTTTAIDAPSWTVSAEDEYRLGSWKAKYVTVPSSWKTTKKST